jgi:hypothetical protein
MLALSVTDTTAIRASWTALHQSGHQVDERARHGVVDEDPRARKEDEDQDDEDDDEDDQDRIGTPLAVMRTSERG